MLMPLEMGEFVQSAFVRVFSNARLWKQQTHSRHLFFSTKSQCLSNNGGPKINNVMSTSKLVSGKVVELYKLSEQVKGLKILVTESQQFAFKAGQWIDLYAPGLTQAAGFSICSSPEYYRESQLIELAVKYTNYPPTKWIHNECKINSQVQISQGGSFYFDINEQTDKDCDILLLAGGVGINPLLSIFRHIARHSILRKKAGLERLPKVLLLYCASKYDDFIFMDTIVEEVSNCPNLTCEFLITSEATNWSKDLSPNVKLTSGQRLNNMLLKTRLTNHFQSINGVNSFICGPNAFIGDLNKALLEIGLTQEQIKFEKWW